MRVLVVDDSAFMRRAMTQMLTSDPHIEVVGTGRNGKEGLALAKSLEPDVITMDIEMPEMDGLTALRRIMKECPTQVMMVSSLTTEGSHVALQALKLGAADILAKDMSQVSLSITNIQQDLISRVRALALSKKHSRHKSVFAAADHHDQPPTFRPGQFDAIYIGSSTGGPPVLERILVDLPASLSVPVVVAQHMPEIFTKSMAERLDNICSLKVVHAENHMPIEPRTIYIAPGGHHVHINKRGLARWELLVNNQPTDAVYKPSVDALFHSAAKHTASRSLAIVLTGIGQDGLEGGRALHARNGTILAQNEETCVVYGMPKAVTENALVAASLTPEQIAASLLTLASASSQGASRAG